MDAYSKIAVLSTIFVAPMASFTGAAEVTGQSPSPTTNSVAMDRPDRVLRGMKALVRNSGSSSLSFSLFERERELLLADPCRRHSTGYGSLLPSAANMTETRRFKFSNPPVIERNIIYFVFRQYLVATGVAAPFAYGTRSAKRSIETKTKPENRGSYAKPTCSTQSRSHCAPFDLCLP